MRRVGCHWPDTGRHRLSARAMMTTPVPSRARLCADYRRRAGQSGDRIIHGAVVDFVSLHYAGYYWYVFNLADIWISLASCF